MLSNLTGWHFIVILFIVLLLFGAPKLPALARSLGQSMKIFKSEIRTEPTADAAAADSPATAYPAAPATSPATGVPPTHQNSAPPAGTAHDGADTTGTR